MSQQTFEGSRELDIYGDLGWDEVELVHDQKHTPILESNVQAEPRLPANWYDVSCNAGRFLVRATHEVFIADTLTTGFQQVRCQKLVGEGKDAQLLEESFREVMGLPEVCAESLLVEQVTGPLVNYYDETFQPEVTYLGPLPPQD